MNENNNSNNSIQIQKPISENGNYKCPNCNNKLNNDELASGRCFTCNTYFNFDYNEIIKTKESPKSTFFNKIVGIVAILLLLFIALVIFFSTNNNINVENENISTEITTDFASSIKNSTIYPSNLKDFYYNLYVLSNNQTNYTMSNIGTIKDESYPYSHWFLVNNLHFEYEDNDNSFSVEFNTSDNKPIKVLIPYIIMALDSNINNETANNYADSLINSFVKYKGSDVIDIGNYTIYLFTDKISEAYGHFDIVNLKFRLKTDPLSKLNLNEYKNLTYEQLLNPMYKGEKVKVTLTISSITIVDIFENSFEATDSFGNEYKIVYNFDSFPHWFLPSEQYEFYCSVATPSTTPHLVIDGYKKQ